jgi:hypothetical protein
MNAGHHKFVFQLKDPLYLVAVAKTGESEAHLRDQLLYLHSQILSVLTSLQLTKIFEQRINFDLRRLLSGKHTFTNFKIRAYLKPADMWFHRYRSVFGQSFNPL